MEGLGLISVYLSVLLGGAIFTGLLIFGILLKDTSLGNVRYFIAGVIFNLVFHLNTYLLFITGQLKVFPNLLGISYPGLFLIGPLFYFFIRSYENSSFKGRTSDILHLIPFLIVTFYQVPYYFKSHLEKEAIVDYIYNDASLESFELQNWLLGNVFMFLIIFYLFACLFIISKTNYKDVSAIKNIVYIIIATGTFYLFFQTGFIVVKVDAVVAEIILACLFSMEIFALGYNVVDFSNIFLKSKKYKTSPVSKLEAAKIEREVIDALENGRLFLSPDFKIKDLSDVTNIPAHHISQVLNENMKVSFHGLINEYRVAHAKRLIIDGKAKNISLEAIGLESGYKNRSSFYRAFKKITGSTPATFIPK